MSRYSQRTVILPIETFTVFSNDIIYTRTRSRAADAFYEWLIGAMNSFAASKRNFS